MLRAVRRVAGPGRARRSGRVAVDQAAGARGDHPAPARHARAGRARAVLRAPDRAFRSACISAARQDTLADFIARSAAILGLSVPGFWLATLLIVLPAIWWGWTPASGFVEFSRDPGARTCASSCCPRSILGIASAAALMRLTRGMLLEVLRQDYVRTAWAKGLRRAGAWCSSTACKNAHHPGRHAARHSSSPVIGRHGDHRDRSSALPGMGRFLFDAINQRDYPVIQGVNLARSSRMIVMINLIGRSRSTRSSTRGSGTRSDGSPDRARAPRSRSRSLPATLARGRGRARGRRGLRAGTFRAAQAARRHRRRDRAGAAAHGGVRRADRALRLRPVDPRGPHEAAQRRSSGSAPTTSAATCGAASSTARGSRSPWASLTVALAVVLATADRRLQRLLRGRLRLWWSSAWSTRGCRFPYLVIILSVMAVLGPGLLNSHLARPMLIAATDSRVIRGATLRRDAERLRRGGARDGRGHAAHHRCATCCPTWPRRSSSWPPSAWAR